DWAKDPARIDVPYAVKVAAIGDIHGSFHELAASLECLGMAKVADAEKMTLTWTGGKDLLVFTGDFTDRGKYTREVYEAVMDLEQQAAKAGGRVIALFGNHEALLLNGQVEKWANTLKPPKKQHYQNTIDSFTKAGLDFHQAISPKGKVGAWIRRRPIVAVVNGFLFVHGGLPSPARSLSDITADFQEGLDAEAFSKGIFMEEKGPLWHREWWNDQALVEDNLQRMGVRGVVFGHTIGALGTEGEIACIGDRVINIDIGMCPTYGNSKGGGLLITIEKNGQMQFTAKYPDRPEKDLMKVPAPVVPAVCPRPRPANEVLPRTGTGG
ncbi:MAG TPA: metallophosphoesterase, partial [Candidatus Ozemobacteraceae bacterium]|nr:metallophosphoesterase [Candidatus Ozemobacteraceae bacterium]